MAGRGAGAGLGFMCLHIRWARARSNGRRQRRCAPAARPKRCRDLIAERSAASSGPLEFFDSAAHGTTDLNPTTFIETEGSRLRFHARIFPAGATERRQFPMAGHPLVAAESPSPVTGEPNMLRGGL